MGLMIDPPNTAARGRLWCHVASDASYAELHAFARTLGIPEQGFDRDHYDVPEEWYDAVVGAGAQPVSSRELVVRLTVAGLRRPKARTLAPRRPGRPLLRPPRLRRGDVVAVVSPAGPVDPERLDAGLDVLRGWGLRPRVATPSARGSAAPAYLAAADRERAAELEHALTDEEVRAVWATRGGYGTQRVLDLLDWSRVAAATPRVLVGFSDVTALHQAVGARLGLASVHGPGVAGLGNGRLGDGDQTVEATRRLLMEPGPVVLQGSPSPAAGRVAEGVLVGGNLALLASSVGTPLVRPAEGGIALLEDVGERPYRLDRALTQLLRSGWFAGVRGVACGSFAACGAPDEVRAVLQERLAPLGVPILYDLPFGHATPNLPVPLGVRGRLDLTAGTLWAAQPVV